MGDSGLVAIALLVLLYAAVSKRLQGSVVTPAIVFVAGDAGQQRGARLARPDDPERARFVLFGAVMLVPVLDELSVEIVLYALLSLTGVRAGAGAAPAPVGAPPPVG